MISYSVPRQIERLIDVRRRIHRVVDYIDENLDADLSLDRLAAIACLSPFHFHRVYSRMVGMSPADTVRQLRLLRAAEDVTTRRASVSQATVMAGYGSPQAFARAFRREFGHTATQMRALAAGRKTSDDVLDFTIVEHPSIELDGFMHNDVRGEAERLSVDAQTFSRVFTAGRQLGMAVYFDSVLTPSDSPLRCALCVTGDRKLMPPELPLEHLQIEGGLYARVKKHGRMFDLTAQWVQFVSQILPNAGWVQRQGPILREFLSDRATTPPSQRVCYIDVPVAKLTHH
jgi:AraC family transcriptional regulator